MLLGQQTYIVVYLRSNSSRALKAIVFYIIQKKNGALD